jgi:predicted aspartyl protease
VPAEISFRLAGGAQPLILLPVSVNGAEPREFILDTGAGTTVLTGALADVAGVRATGTKEGMGAGGRVVVQTGEARSLAVGDATESDVAVVITDGVERIGAVIGSKVHGALGYSFLKHFRMEIDYGARRIRLDRASGTPDPAGLPFRLAHPAKPIILVPAMVNGGGPHTFAIDTGASTTVIAPALAGTLGLTGSRVPAMTGGGGTVQAFQGMLRSLAIGNTRCENVTVMVADFLLMLAQAIQAPLDGIVGYNVLRMFRVGIDYPRSLLSLRADGRS